MLSPSDIAPESVHVNSATGLEEQLVFSTDQISFLEDGGLCIMFFGIKNDTYRDGFRVTIPAVSIAKRSDYRS